MNFPSVRVIHCVDEGDVTESCLALFSRTSSAIDI